MKKKYFPFVVALSILFSCGTDDGLVPVDIETQPDSISISQNSQIEIFVFSNDSNIPNSGQMTISSPQKGIASILDPNNTPNNPSDDSIQYTANPNEVGLDSFEYIICNASGNCKTESVDVTILSGSNVAFNLDNMPYQTLSEYQLFDGVLKDLDPSFGVTPYTLNSTLFTDYAKKERFIWLPPNTKATYVNDHVPLDFPVGAIIIKNFYYDHVLPNDDIKNIETRLMIMKSEGWVFADYVWNADQTEAVLDLNGSFVNIQWQNNDELTSTQYRIPSEAECITCHKVMETPMLIGPKPRNLNLIYNYSSGSANQLSKLIELGYLENTLPNTVSATPDYNDETVDLELRARAYLDINCAHCHSEETHCSYRPMRFSFQDTESYTNIGVCVDPDTDLELELNHIVEPGDSRHSVLHFRLNSTEPSYRMPLLGRTLVHAEGVELIENWIDSLTETCE
ncbi:hypothetical protein [Sediminibacter sp. Hel_I_10]|uniref:Ig-like domain-containing protein n=1 Tax=Sediminibacter sp. Hel_I_10 TaxID=1392490 RepID=UPI0005684B22|nr:hypothetical protein [Sediminibacter sp. Hel_I_10]